MKVHPTPSLQDHRAARVRGLSHAVSGALVAAAAGTAAALFDTPVAALLAALLLVTAAFVVADPGNHLLATVAPLPLHGADLVTAVSTVRVEAVRPAPGVYPTHETAVAEQFGVLRVGAHSLRALAESDTPTGVIPAVTA